MKMMKKMLLFTLCLAMMLPAFASMAYASPIADEDFEDMTTGDLIVPDWNVTSASNNGAVIEKAPDAIRNIKPEEPAGPALTKALGSVGSENYDQGTLTLSGTLPATKEISFDIYATDSSYKGAVLQLGDDTGYSMTLIFFKPSANSSYASYGDAFLVGYAGAGGSIVAPSYHSAYTPVLATAMKNGEYMKLGEWHNIRIAMTAGSATAALYIDNHKVADIKASASISTINKINYMRMSWDKGAQGIYLDNIKLVGSDGSTYYSDDFESYGEGNAPSSWVMLTGKSYEPLKIAEIEAPNKVLEFIKNESNPIISLNVSETPNEYTSAVSFDVYVDSSTSETGLRFELYGGESIKAIINLFRPKTTDTAYAKKMMLGYLDSAHSKLENLSYNAKIVPALPTDPAKLLDFDKWYNIRLEWAKGASVGTLYVDGVAVCNTVTIDNAAVNAVDRVLLQPGNKWNKDDLYIDNIEFFGDQSRGAYFTEDFEDSDAGYSPKGWVVGTAGMLVGIKHKPTPQAEPNKAVAFERPKASTSVNSVITLSSGVPAFTSEASFKVYVASTSWKGALIDFNNGSSLKVRLGFADGSLSGDPTTYKDKVYMYTYDTSNSTVIQPTYENNKAILPVAILEKSAWYDVTVKFSEGSSRAEVYVNGELALRTAFDAAPAKKAIDKIVIQNMSSQNGEIIYFDDITLKGSGASEPYYFNDFQGETVGSDSASMTHGSGKVTMKIVETPAFVTEEELPTTETVKGTNAYKVYQNGSGQTMTYRNFKPTDKLSVSFDYMATAVSVESGSYISLSSGMGSGSWFYSLRIFRKNGADSTAALTYDNGSSYATLADVELGVWYNIKMELENGKAQVYFEGEPVVELSSEKTVVDGIFFGTTSGRSANDVYYIDNLKFTGAEGIEMNDTPIVFTDSFDSEPAGYAYSGGGTHSVSGGKLILSGVTATRGIDPTRSGLFGLKLASDKPQGITVALYQDSVTAVALKMEEDGTLLCKRGSGWMEISDPGKVAAGEEIELSLDLAPDRNSNYFNVRVNGEIVGTALYDGEFNYISLISVSVPSGTEAQIDSLYAEESDGVLNMAERQESSPEVYLPMVIEGAKTMYLSGDTSPSRSSLKYASGSESLVLDTKNSSIGVDLGSVRKINGLRITGTAEIARPSNHTNYAIYQSDDNLNWIRVQGFSMNHFTENGVSVTLFEVTGVEARYLKVLSFASSAKFNVASVRAEVRIDRQWKMAGNAMVALDDTDPVYTSMTRELYDRAITVEKGDSVGINFGINSHVEAIELVGEGLSGLDEGAFKLYFSSDNEKYTLIENVTLSRDTRGDKEVYRLSFEDIVCGYLKLYASAEMTVTLDDLYDGLCAYSSVEVASGYTNDKWNNQRGGEGDYYTLPDGTLVMIYTGYPIGGAHGDYADNVLKMVHSTDGGYTWSASWITLRKQDSYTNVMCASVHYMANGDLAIVYCEKLPGEVAHMVIRRSTDYGRTWGEPLIITEEPLGYSIVSSAVNGLHLSNGRFVLAINYSYETADCHGSPRSVSYLAYSDDDGYTWEMSNFVTLPNAALEPVVAELDNGDLIMTMRTRKENSIYQTISTDNGETWAQPVRVENMNTPSSTNSVHTHPSTGDLMIVWNDEVYDAGSRDGGNGNRDPLSVAISTDHGLTYKNQRNLVDGGASWACIRFYGRAMQLQYSSYMKVIDIAELYHTREGSKTVADLPVAATPSAVYENGWLSGVSATMTYSLDGGATWRYCGGSSVQLGEVSGDILVRDMGNSEFAPSGVQTVGSTTVLASSLGILPGNVSEADLNSLIAMAGSGSYTFVFDSGVYLFPKTIDLPSNTTLMGGADTVFMLDKGASGKSASPAVIKIGTRIDNVRITGLTIKGHNDSLYCPTYSSGNVGILINKALRVNIDHVNVEGFADSGIKATNMGCEFYNDSLTYDQRQAYFKGLQLSDCRIEKCYYGLHLGSRAEYCQITNLAAGYNNVGCVNSGGNNSFVNCFFNNNTTGYYLYCTNMSNPGHGAATGCSFNHNKENALIVEGNKIGFSFTGCQFFDGKIIQTSSCGTVFSASIFGSVELEASGSAGSGTFAGCFFQTSRDAFLAGNNGVFTVVDCIDLPAASAVAVSAEYSAEPQMTLLSAVTEKPRAYSGTTTIMASELGVVAGEVTEAALDSLTAKASEGGYTFVFDSGVYIFPKMINIPSNTTFMGGAGTVFMLSEAATANSSNFALINVGSLTDNVRISNLTVKGYNESAYCHAYSKDKNGIYVSQALRVNLDNLKVVGFADSGVKVVYSGCDNSSATAPEQRQAYFRGVQISNCRFEKNYYGLNLGKRGEYNQITNVTAGYNNVGCLNAGGNNSFVNCSFNNNNTGFSLDCTDMPNPGHGGASGCSFIKNNNEAVAVKNNKIGFTFNGCNIQGDITSENSVGTVFNACIIDGSLQASGEQGSGIIYGCRIKNEDSLNSGAGQIFSVVDCIGFDSAIATPDASGYQIAESTPEEGRAVAVAALGIVPGVVSAEAIDALADLAADGGYVLKFESGVYQLEKSLEIPSNTTVVGCANTVFKLVGSNLGKLPVISVVGADNVKLDSFIVLGDSTQNYVENTSIGHSDGSVGIYISNSSRVVLSNLTVKDFKSAAAKIENVGLPGYTETVQVSDCRFENSYYGLQLTNTASFCQVVRTVMGYCASGCIDQGFNNSFANCFFNCNRCGFYVHNTNSQNVGAGTVVNSSFTHNVNYNLRIDDCVNGYSFSGCVYQGGMRQANSKGIVISSSVLCSVKTQVSGSAESCLMIGCFFQTDKTATLSGNNGVYKVVDCIEVPAE